MSASDSAVDDGMAILGTSRSLFDIVKHQVHQLIVAFQRTRH